MYADGVRENWIAAFPRLKIDERRFAEGTLTADGLEIRRLPTSPREYVEKSSRRALSGTRERQGRNARVREGVA